MRRGLADDIIHRLCCIAHRWFFEIFTHERLLSTRYASGLAADTSQTPQTSAAPELPVPERQLAKARFPQNRCRCLPVGRTGRAKCCSPPACHRSSSTRLRTVAQRTGHHIHAERLQRLACELRPDGPGCRQRLRCHCECRRPRASDLGTADVCSGWLLSPETPARVGSPSNSVRRESRRSPVGANPTRPIGRSAGSNQGDDGLNSESSIIPDSMGKPLIMPALAPPPT